MKNQYNVWCKWHPLKTVILGDCYPVSFFDGLKDPNVKSALTRITEETLSDLEYYESVLKSFGCEVLRPKIDPSLNIMDFIGRERKNNLKSIPRAPLQPRDDQFVFGNKLFISGVDANGEFVNLLQEYNKTDLDFYKNADTDLTIKVSIEDFEAYAGKDWLSYYDYLQDDYFERVSPEVKKEHIKYFHRVKCPDPPSVTLVGRDIYIDLNYDKHDPLYNTLISPSVFDYFKTLFPNIRIHKLNHKGHSDGCFHTLKPGAILSLNEIQRYEETFPNWDICYLPNQSWQAIPEFLQMKEYVNGRWWVPGEEGNNEFIMFVEKWLNEWVGYCEESVFDVNVLMLDQHHVCVNNYNETAFAFFKKHKIEPIIVPWRHRYFWDGGLHCITLDLYREGEMEDYFPSRTKEIVDLGYN